jgi:hypothetical protein
MKTYPKFCSSRGDEAHSEKAESEKRKAEMNERLLTSSPTVQNKPKSESDIVMSDLNKRFLKSDKGMLNSDKGILESDKGFLKPDRGMLESNKGFLSSDKGLSESDKGLLKPDKGMLESDKGFWKTNKGLSEFEMVIKMVKNRHLTRKRQKMGQFFSHSADFSKTCIAASRQRAASIIIWKNTYDGKRGVGPPHSKTLRVRDDSWKTRSILECASPLALCHADQDSGATPESARATHALPGILKRRKSQRLSCFPASV